MNKDKKLGITFVLPKSFKLVLLPKFDYLNADWCDHDSYSNSTLYCGIWV